MYYNLNGKLIQGKYLSITTDNRGLNYGDGVFETIRYSFNKLCFWEDHYFRLMSSMRIVRMEIPMHFSPEFLQEEIMKVIEANGLKERSARVKFLTIRKAGGKYTPQHQDIDYLVTTEELDSTDYRLNETGLHVDLYKDYYVPKGLLSNIKSSSAQLYTVASIYRMENDFDECILLNEDKHVVEAISSNLFMVKGEDVYTPPLSTGCLKGIMRKRIIDLIPGTGLRLIEEPFSPFELQKADEVFLTNAISGIKWVKNYRKKEYKPDIAEKLISKLNAMARLS